MGINMKRNWGKGKVIWGSEEERDEVFYKSFGWKNKRIGWGFVTWETVGPLGGKWIISAYMRGCHWRRQLSCFPATEITSNRSKRRVILFSLHLKTKFVLYIPSLFNSFSYISSSFWVWRLLRIVANCSDIFVHFKVE